MNKDLHNNISTCMMLEGTDITADATSNLLDTKGFESAEILVVIGALTGVDGSNHFQFKLQESDSVVGTSFTDVDAKDILGAFTKVDAATEDSTIQRVGYKGTKRYVRVDINETGTISAGILAVVGILGNGRSVPSADVAPASAT